MPPKRKNKKGQNKKGRSDSDDNAAESAAATSNPMNDIDHDRELAIFRLKFYFMHLMQRKLAPLQTAMDTTREALHATIGEQQSAMQALDSTNSTNLQRFLHEEEYKRTKQAYYNICCFQEMHSIIQDRVMETIDQFRDEEPDGKCLIRMMGEILGEHSMYAGVLGELRRLCPHQHQ